MYLMFYSIKECKFACFIFFNIKAWQETLTGLDLIKKACHPPATAPTPTARTDRANDFKFLLDVHKYCLFPATSRNCEFLSQFYTIFNKPVSKNVPGLWGALVLGVPV